MNAYVPDSFNGTLDRWYYECGKELDEVVKIEYRSKIKANRTHIRGQYYIFSIAGLTEIAIDVMDDNFDTLPVYQTALSRQFAFLGRDPANCRRRCAFGRSRRR